MVHSNPDIAVQGGRISAAAVQAVPSARGDISPSANTGAAPVEAADHVESLLGVIYVPSARLIVEGTADVARESAWTVIVAREVRLSGSPSLFINANYSASDVPVPSGVGPRTGGSRLIDQDATLPPPQANAGKGWVRVPDA
jgi:hypothetical protein